MFFLSDRRQSFLRALAALSHPLPSESSVPPLSTLSAGELQSLPSVPLSDLEPETLLRVAQVIYTASLKVQLIARPVLVGSLCRIENWCDVEEVEELLKAQKASLLPFHLHSEMMISLAEIWGPNRFVSREENACESSENVARVRQACQYSRHSQADTAEGSRKRRKTDWTGTRLPFDISKSLVRQNYLSSLNRQNGFLMRIRRWLFRYDSFTGRTKLTG